MNFGTDRELLRCLHFRGILIEEWTWWEEFRGCATLAWVPKMPFKCAHVDYNPEGELELAREAVKKAFDEYLGAIEKGGI